MLHNVDKKGIDMVKICNGFMVDLEIYSSGSIMRLLYWVQGTLSSDAVLKCTDILQHLLIRDILDHTESLKTEETPL